MSDRLDEGWEAELDLSGEIPEFRAAQDVRISTLHQQDSTLNQFDKIREYAEKPGIKIIETYADDIKCRPSHRGRRGPTVADRRCRIRRGRFQCDAGLPF